jgi:phasin protein
LIYINAKSQKKALISEASLAASSPDCVPPALGGHDHGTKNPDAFEPARQAAEQMTERTQEAIANYFSWFQNAMQASLWGNTDLNKKLMSYATETVTAPLSFMQKLSQAKNLEDVVKIQTEFVKAQTDSFNKHAKELGEIYTKVTTPATKTPFGMST